MERFKASWIGRSVSSLTESLGGARQSTDSLFSPDQYVQYPLGPSESSDSLADFTLASYNQPIADDAGSTDFIRTALTGLEALKTVLEAVDSFPFVKKLASLGIHVLRYISETQIPDDRFRGLAFRAKNIILAVAKTCRGQQSIASDLEDDSSDLMTTMKHILDFASKRASRSNFDKFLHKAADEATVQSLEKELSDALELFHVKSNRSFEFSLRQISEQISTISLAIPESRQSDRAIPSSPARTASVHSHHSSGASVSSSTSAWSLDSFLGSEPDLEFTNCNLRVQEGIYLISNASSNCVIETRNLKALPKSGVPAYMAASCDGKLRTQLWLIQKIGNTDFEYMIRSMATGMCLGYLKGRHEGPSVVATSSWSGPAVQAWTFWGARRGTSEDYCTIRNSGSPKTVLDDSCDPDSRSKSHELSATAIPPSGPAAAQEWNLIRLSSLPSPDPHDSVSDIFIPRRAFLLQNVRTGMFATRSEDVHEPNVTLTREPNVASAWTFIYVSLCLIGHTDKAKDCFAIASDSDTACTIGHYGKTHINANVTKHWLTNDNHKWMPLARDGVFIFINAVSTTLLAASRTQSEYVDVIPSAARKDASCHWRLLDAKTRESVRVLYDSGISIMPLELSGTPPPPPPGLSSELYTGTASKETRLAMLKDVHREHQFVREALLDKSQVLVAAPRLIQGWGNGNPWEWPGVIRDRMNNFMGSKSEVWVNREGAPEDGPVIEEVDDGPVVEEVD